MYIIKIAKDTVSALDVVGYGVVPHLMTSSRVMWCRAMLYFFSRSADCGMKVDGEKADCMMRLMRVLPTDKVSNNVRVNEVAWRNYFPIREEGSAPRSVPCLCTLVETPRKETTTHLRGDGLAEGVYTSSCVLVMFSVFLDMCTCNRT